MSNPTAWANIINWAFSDLKETHTAHGQMLLSAAPAPHPGSEDGHRRFFFRFGGKMLGKMIQQQQQQQQQQQPPLQTHRFSEQFAIIDSFCPHTWILWIVWCCTSLPRWLVTRMTMMIWHVKANGDPLPETTRFRQSMYTVHSKQYESIRMGFRRWHGIV